MHTSDISEPKPESEIPLHQEPAAPAADHHHRRRPFPPEIPVSAIFRILKLKS